MIVDDIVVNEFARGSKSSERVGFLKRAYSTQCELLHSRSTHLGVRADTAIACFGHRGDLSASIRCDVALLRLQSSSHRDRSDVTPLSTRGSAAGDFRNPRCLQR
jgi:hypothetical protein